MRRKLLAIVLALTLLLTSLPAALAEDAPEGEPAQTEARQAEPEKEPEREQPAESAPAEEKGRSESDENPSDDGEKTVVIPEEEPTYFEEKTVEQNDGLTSDGGEDTGNAPKGENEGEATPTEGEAGSNDGSVEGSDGEGGGNTEGEGAGGEGGNTEGESAGGEGGGETGGEGSGEAEACKHTSMKRVINRKAEGIRYTDLENGTHKITGKDVYSIICAECGKVLESADSYTEACTCETVDGVSACVYCGHPMSCDCTHPEAARVYSVQPTTASAVRAIAIITGVEDNGDGDTHALFYKYVPYWECTDCGYREYLVDEAVEDAIDEDHKLVNGVCTVCDYACPHDEVDGAETLGAPYYEAMDEEGHVEIIPTVVSGTCLHCGMKVKNVQVDYEEGDYTPHIWRKGVCTLCGYECEHPDDAIIEKTFKPGYDYREFDDEGHMVVKSERYRISCGICGTVLFEDVDILNSFYEEHDIENGECYLCGYETRHHSRDDDDDEDEDDDEDDEEEKRDEDTVAPDGFVNLSAYDRLNGVAVSDGLTMLQTAERVGDSMQHAVDAGYKNVSIVNIDLIFSADEQAALKALPVRDQLIASLYFLGYRDVVLEGMNRDIYLVADQTRNLISSVDYRISAMSDADRKALSNTIRRYFPRADFQIRPGVTTEVFNLDLRVVENGAVTYERYGFHQTGSDWSLINIATKAG